MVERYKASLGVPVAPVAKPRESGQAMLAEAVGGLANQALQIASKKIEERTASLEAASINAARIELEKRGGQLAIDLQKGRIAGSDYVRDLETARAGIKDEVWGKLPKRVQSSTRARMAFDDIWTSDHIQATRSAAAWQAGQEKDFAVRTLNDGLTEITAKVEADPDGAKGHLENWTQTVPAFGGLLDAETLEQARTKGVQAILQGSVRGLAKKGRFEEAEKVLSRAAAQLDPQQRRAFEAVIEDSKNDIERQRSRAETEMRKAYVLNANAMEIDILDGKAGRQQIDDGVKSGAISPNDQPALIRAHRAEVARREAEAKLGEDGKAALADSSLDALQMLSTMPSLWRMDPEEWATEAPQAYELYQGMDRDRRRAVRQKHIEFLQTGETQDSAMGVYRDLVARARRQVPENWKLTTETVFGEGDGLAFSSQLYAHAKRYAEENGGKAIPEKEAREIVARSLNAFKPYKKGLFGSEGFALPPDIAMRDTFKNVDFDLMSEIKSRLAKRLGREPTNEEVSSAYQQVQAQ